MASRQRLYSFSFIAIIALTAIEELKLRPYLFKNHLLAFGIAGSLPNFLAPLILLFGSLVLRLRPSEQLFRTAVTFVVGLIIYELAQPFMEGRVFDVKDIVASILGGLFGYCWVLGINKLSPLNKKEE